VSDRYVLDASALLAALFGEPGSDAVDAMLADSVIGAVNFSEVIAKLNERGVPDEEASASLAELDLTIVPFDREQAEIAGRLRAATRTGGLSLGGRSCLALAISLNARAVTTDRAWAEIAVGVPVDVLR
jgi:PIN domain nuclease of toxin-antitoxin system